MALTVWKIILMTTSLTFATAASQPLRVTFFVKHQPAHVATLLETLKNVSDPSHSQYGQHLTHEQVVALQRPLDANLAAVRAHIRSAGGIEAAASLAGDKIVATFPSHAAASASVVPASLLGSIDAVVGYPRSASAIAARRAAPRVAGRRRNASASSSDDPQSCLKDRAVPPCLRAAYGISDVVGSASGNSQAVIVNQGYKMSDLKAFCSEYKLDHCPASVTDVGKNSGGAGDEATLDVQYITAMGQGVPLTWVYINGHTDNPFASWLTWASNTSSIPWVHSLSVGEPEDELAQFVPRMNQELAALGARGVSVVFASGDSGYQKAQKYPSSSPYVTSVGGVFNGELGMSELEVDSETTGGFSSLAANPIQSWQTAAVAAWTKTKGSRPGKVDTTRRCCPDLSIYDAGFYTIQDGSDQPIGGTSAAAPTLAGMISLINDARLAAKKPTLGFLNPFLYQNQAAFLDITRGDNNGFAATEGYDPASGLGTFAVDTFAKLKAAAMKAVEVAAETGADQGDAAPAAEMPTPTLLVGLRHGPEAKARLEELFWAVADPANTTAEQVAGPRDLASLVAADEATLEAAKAWLDALGADLSTLRLVPTGDALEVEWPRGAGRTKAPRAPGSFADYVLLKGAKPVTTTSPFYNARKKKKNRAAGGGAALKSESSFGPTGQKAAYGVPAGLKGTNKGNVQMVWGPGTFGYREDDIKLFFNTYATSSSTSDVAFDEANKWTGATGKNFVEGELDVSYIAAMAPGVKTLVANTNTSAATEAGEGFGAALLAFLVELNGRAEVPLVLSMSLGSLSFGSCDKVCKALEQGSANGHTYAQCWSYLQSQFQACMFGSAAIETRIDAELQKLGLRGTTVTAASGDGASHFAFGPFSGGIGGELDSIICKSMHMPVYPTCSPYVLSVGGIQWSSDDMYGPECSASKPCGWTDGGAGFSWAHQQPAYQAKAVSAYLALGPKVAPKTMPAPATFNGAGRGYPDVAALAQFGIPLCDYGGCSGSGGTSASAPTVAGMLSLVNDKRLNAGLKPLGFVNTKLYSLMADPDVYAECFADVGIDKVGDEWDCNTYSSCDGCDDGGGVGPGFVATKGWDAQTGFGQPRFAGWLKHLGSD